MKLYLLRHGDAIENSSNDRLRPLSEQGRADVEKIGEFLKSRNVQIQKIYTSPLLRAYQTAEIVSKKINYTDEISELDYLLPVSDPNELINFLTRQTHQSVLLVTHQPFIGQFVSLILFGRTVMLNITKSSLLFIETNEKFSYGSSILNYLVNPEIL